MAANRTGIRTVVFNNRGLGGVELKTPRLYCASNSEDLSEVISHVKKLNPHIKIGATGISMGGLILGNYLANYGDEAKSILTAAKIISVPWDVNKGKSRNISVSFLLLQYLLSMSFSGCMQFSFIKKDSFCY